MVPNVPSGPFRLSRPGRAVAAFADTFAALALTGLAWWCWHRGVIVTVQDGVPTSRINGAWWAVAVAAATLAGVALLDALRQALGAAARLGARRPRV